MFADLVSKEIDLYYRLQQVDFDGKNTLSPTLFTKGINVVVPTLSIFPNPITTSTQAYIKLANISLDSYNISIIDVKGAIIWRQIFTQTNSSGSLQIPISCKLLKRVILLLYKA